jgi:predicted acyl esterase
MQRGYPGLNVAQTLCQNSYSIRRRKPVIAEATETASGTAPRYAVRRERNLRIPMPDGATLAADLFLPNAPGRYPVVMEHLPYRKNDRTWQGYFGHR